jgi:hypothetical protein
MNHADTADQLHHVVQGCVAADSARRLTPLQQGLACSVHRGAAVAEEFGIPAQRGNQRDPLSTALHNVDYRHMTECESCGKQGSCNAELHLTQTAQNGPRGTRVYP